MSDAERLELLQVNEDLRVRFSALSPEDKRRRLIAFGLLDASGQVPSTYGGPGKATHADGEQVMATSGTVARG